VSFSYERNGFASFATKRSLKFIFTDRCKQFYALSSMKKVADEEKKSPLTRGGACRRQAGIVR
jgi:hypothetical protein